MNILFIRKRKFLPLFLLLILLGCDNITYKRNIRNKAEVLIQELKSGNLDVIPGYTEQSEKLTVEQKSAIKSSFSTMEFWTINVEEIDSNGIVDVYVNVDMDDVNKSLIFQYKKNNGDWTLQEKMEIKQNITYVPNQVTKEAE